MDHRLFMACNVCVQIESILFDLALHRRDVFKNSVTLALLTGRCIVQLLADVLVPRHNLLYLIVVGQ